MTTSSEGDRATLMPASIAHFQAGDQELALVIDVPAWPRAIAQYDIHRNDLAPATTRTWSVMVRGPLVLTQALARQRNARQ